MGAPPLPLSPLLSAGSATADVAASTGCHFSLPSSYMPWAQRTPLQQVGCLGSKPSPQAGLSAEPAPVALLGPLSVQCCGRWWRAQR